MATATADIKLGFWLGLGIFLAMTVLALAQAGLYRIVKRGG